MVYYLNLSMKNKTKLVRSYFSNGKLHYEHTMLNGDFHGKMKMWHQNGNLEVEYTKFGFFDQGMELKWYDDKTRKLVKCWKDDILNGLIIYFDYQ